MARRDSEGFPVIDAQAIKRPVKENEIKFWRVIR
ncbi:hypothetical protein QOZ97_000432 [Qipengyuania citrea]|jgi:hypothetical protein|uniref:Uncharacterized protein n=1 Tax=Qipengyuania citrea TaxID=225971 RepID=A0ABU0N660_9SPHN|nr:hypothetical protein [Qipengyuania citrea]